MLSGIDLAVLGAYVAWSAASGLASAKKAGTGLEEYVLAGRSLSGWSAGISMAATQFAADTPLVVTGLVATSGLFALWRLWIYAIAFLLLGFVLGASWRRAGVITDAELSELRYGGRPAAALRMIKAVHFGIFFNCTVLAMVLLATTRIVEPFGRWDLWLDPALFATLRSIVQALGLSLAGGSGICDATCTAECIRATCFDASAWDAATSNTLSLGVVLIVTMLYSTTGGLRAVVRTDFVQFVIAIVASIAYAGLIVDRVGGLEGLHERVSALSASTGAGESLLAMTPFEAAQGTLPLSLLAVLAVQWLAQINADGSGYLAQRTMACRSDRDARIAGVVFTVAQVLVRSLIWIPIALGLIVLFPPSAAMDTAAREATYVRGIAEVLPPGLLGLMLAGMMGALASTLDTHLNWGASYVSHDLWARFVAPRALGRAARPRELVMVARLSNVALLIVALAIVPRLESIQTAWHASLLLGAGLGVVLVMRWMWWRTSASAELAAIATSMVLAPIALFTIDEEPVRLLLVAGGATLMAVLVARFGPAEDPARLRAFFERAQPPGFWGPVAG
nr:sodium transporter [Myxococcota bacterium]